MSRRSARTWFGKTSSGSTSPQPLYTGGRLNHAYGAQAATQEASRLDVERAQQALTLRVYETFYAALMAEQGVRVSTEGVEIAERHLDLAQVQVQRGIGGAARRPARGGGTRERASQADSCAQLRRGVVPGAADGALAAAE